MNSRELMKAAMRREPTERISTMPQICHDMPIRVEAAELGANWREGYRRCAEDPKLVYDYVIRLAERVRCDGLRLFKSQDPVTAVLDGEDVIVLDSDSHERIGKLDLYGGGALLLDKPDPPVQSLDEARKRLACMVNAFTDEKMELLRKNRARVPDLFVASGPGGITMDTYTVMRGRQQAMMDFFERPDFVSEVMDLQAEAMIQIAEKLLKTDIDAFYIGDPSASASLISPQHFEDFCLPAYQKFCSHFADTDILIYIHICGNSKPILDMMAATGADVIEPLDPLGGVTVADAKTRVGRQVALMGGVSTLTLNNGTAEEVRAEAIAKCRQGGATGYILAAGDMVPPETPLANLEAMVDVARHSLWK